MTEQFPSPESNVDDNVPRLSLQELKQLMSKYFNQEKYVQSSLSQHEVWHDIVQPLILDLRINYPHLAYRGSELGNNINFGLGGSDASSVADAINFDDCFLMGFKLMKDAYTLHGRHIPHDTDQTVWFKGPNIETIGDIFDGIGTRQIEIQRQYPEFANALRIFTRLNMREQQTEISESIGMLAAAEIFDGFHQMEIAAS